MLIWKWENGRSVFCKNLLFLALKWSPTTQFVWSDKSQNSSFRSCSVVAIFLTYFSQLHSWYLDLNVLWRYSHSGRTLDVLWKYSLYGRGQRTECVERLTSYWKFNQVFELKVIFKIFLVPSFCLILFSDDLSACKNQHIELRHWKQSFVKTTFFVTGFSLTWYSRVTGNNHLDTPPPPL